MVYVVMLSALHYRALSLYFCTRVTSRVLC